MTTMEYAFYRCIRLYTLKTTGWDTSKITNMSNMFCMCPSGDAAAGFDVSSVTNMSNMFYDSRVSYSISRKFINWDVSNVKDMKYMFYSAYLGGPIDLSGWDVSNVKDMSYMFYDFGYKIYVNDWNVSNVTNMSYMFADCSWELMEIFIKNWDINDTVNTDYMFTGLYYGPDYHVDNTGVSDEDWARMTAKY